MNMNFIENEFVDSRVLERENTACWRFGQQKNWELSKINVWHNEGNKHPSRYRRKLDEWMSQTKHLTQIKKWLLMTYEI